MFSKVTRYILLFCSLFLFCLLASPIGSGSEGGIPSADRAQQSHSYQLTDEEIEAHQSLMKANGLELLQYSHKLQKRSPETLTACFKHNTFKNSPYGRIPDILYKYYSAACEHPHQSGNYTVTCEALKILHDGRESAIELISFNSSCPIDHYCYSLDADENDVGIYNPKEIEDISCAKREKPGHLQAILVKSSRYTPIKACTDPIDVLDERYKGTEGSTQETEPVNRKFLLQAEVTSSDTGKSALAKELYIEQVSPVQQTVAQARDSFVTSAQVTVQDSGPDYKQLFELCVLATINYSVTYYILYYIIFHIGRFQ